MLKRLAVYFAFALFAGTLLRGQCQYVFYTCPDVAGVSNCWGCGDVSVSVRQDSIVSSSRAGSCLYCYDYTCDEKLNLCEMYRVMIVQRACGGQYETSYAYICCPSCG